ncbi:MAG TPA: GTPase HflX [Gammaproteobacteria bacterium]|nr:GTPase HflX [Gammaproteobacteria bacterium]
MFERPRGGERAVLVSLCFQSRELSANCTGTDGDETLREFRELAVSAAAEPVGTVTGRRKAPESRLFVGSGKAEEIRQQVAESGAEVVLFNHALSPSQERNLERLLQCRVLDRTGLILDIFAQRARTHEGKLQVELAQLKHLSTRLIRGWTHLERQKGGIGLRGPGETQLETDRRLIGERMRQIHRKLQRVERQREQGRRGRKRAELPTLSLVGYTNAGKSTLFNALTDAEVYAADQLFATLDPTLRRIEMGPQQRPAVLADTVGFIRDLPHDLVAAFRSTLQETRDADVLLHVVDAANTERDETIVQVNEVLAEIEAEDVPQLLVYNKIDLLPDGQPRLDRDADGRPWRVWLSAVDGRGVELLHEALGELFAHARVARRIHLPAAATRLRARFYAFGAVQKETTGDNGECLLEVEMDRRDWDALAQHEDMRGVVWNDLGAATVDMDRTEADQYLAATAQAP